MNVVTTASARLSRLGGPLQLSNAMCRRRQKALRAQLDAIQERRAALRPEEGDGEDASWRLGIDEESEREARLAQLELDSIHVSAHPCPARFGAGCHHGVLRRIDVVPTETESHDEVRHGDAEAQCVKWCVANFLLCEYFNSAS